MAIVSKFHKDLSKYEPTYKGGLTKKQIKMVIRMLPGCFAVGLEVMFLNGILFWIVSIITAAVLISPPVLVAFGKWDSFKNDLDFFLKIQDRTLINERIRRYDQSEFIPKKEIKKTNRRK